MLNGSKRKRRMAQCKKGIKASIVVIVIWRAIEFAANAIDINQVTHWFSF